MKVSELWEQLQQVPLSMGDLEVRCSLRRVGREMFPTHIELVTIAGTNKTYFSLEGE